MSLLYDVFETPLGWMGAIASPQGLLRTTLPCPSPDDPIKFLEKDSTTATKSSNYFFEINTHLNLYFEGKEHALDMLPIDFSNATNFLKASWIACRRIPRGETRSYKWLASQTGNPGAARAAGQAMARNRLPIIIPCHRVIASDGSLQGYGGKMSQLVLKKRLLELESTALSVS